MTTPTTARAPDPEVLAVARQVAAIVRRVTDDPARRVVLFGSWASGTAAARSDIDLGIEGPGAVPPETMAAIRDACDALPTLYTVDLVDLARVSPRFRAGLVVRSVEPGAA